MARRHLWVQTRLAPGCSLVAPGLLLAALPAPCLPGGAPSPSSARWLAKVLSAPAQALAGELPRRVQPRAARPAAVSVRGLARAFPPLRLRCAGTRGWAGQGWAGLIRPFLGGAGRGGGGAAVAGVLFLPRQQRACRLAVALIDSTKLLSTSMWQQERLLLRAGGAAGRSRTAEWGLLPGSACMGLYPRLRPLFPLVFCPRCSMWILARKWACWLAPISTPSTAASEPSTPRPVAAAGAMRPALPCAASHPAQQSAASGSCTQGERGAGHALKQLSNKQPRPDT